LKEIDQRKWNTYPENVEFLKKKERLYRFLAAKGFSSHLVSQTLREVTKKTGEF